MIDPKQGPFPTPPRRGRNAAAWIEYQVEATPWRAIDDPPRPGAPSIDEPPLEGPVAIDGPTPPQRPEDATPARWLPEQPRGVGPEHPKDLPRPSDGRPRPH